MKKLTVKFIENDGRDWFAINGHHTDTGVDFNNETFGVAKNGQILDVDGCPLTPGDHQTIAVESLVEQFNRDKNPAEIKTIADLDMGDVVTDGNGQYAEVLVVPCGTAKYYANISREYLACDDEIIIVSDFFEDHLADRDED